MNFLNFLDDVVIENVEPKAARASNAKLQRNPDEDFVGIRIWRTGAVYPSVALATLFALEYPAATVTELPGKDGTMKSVFTVVGNPGNGLDIIDVRQWAQIQAGNKNFIAVGIAPKDSSKIDLFGLTRYAEDGKPLVSVMDQGSATYGKETLLPLIEELYGVVPNEEGFIDMAVATTEAGGKNLKSANGVELLPKKVTRGADKGKADYTRRENIDIFMLYPSLPAVIATTVTETPDKDVVTDIPVVEVESAKELTEALTA